VIQTQQPESCLSKTANFLTATSAHTAADLIAASIPQPHYKDSSMHAARMTSKPQSARHTALQRCHKRKKQLNVHLVNSPLPPSAHN
jgi:hypothetical protein